jgi:predicted aldo/keto reductase-like oxidoreductase
MQYRRFGKTEFQIPVVSCGGMRYQQSWKDSDPVSDESQANLEACIRRALEVGVNHIETARGYGTSEYQLGKILPTLPRDKMLVQTKVEAYESVEKFVDTFEKSMSLLKLDYVDIFSVHGINTMQELEWAMPCLDKAEEWKKQGRIRDIGFSTHAPTHVIQKAIETERFEHVNLHWYYIFQDNWSCIEACAQRDMGVFIISPNDKGGLLYKPSEKLRELCAPLHPMVFNGLWCLQRPEVHTLSCGVARPSDFDEHMEMVALLDQSAELLPPIEARLRDLALAFDMVEYAKMRYNLLGSGGTWFPGRRVKEAADIDAVRPALEKSPYADAIIGYLHEAHAMLQGEQKKRLQQE